MTDRQPTSDGVRIDAFFDTDLAAAVLAVVGQAVGGTPAVLCGAARDRWRSVAPAGLQLLGESDTGDVIVFTTPDEAKRLEKAEDLAQLVERARLVVLPAASPVMAIGDDGRWPQYWADRFATHRWRFVDVIRPQLWEDRRFGPDAKEPWLMFCAPGAFPELLASPPTAMVHPDRITDVVRSVHAELQDLREQFLDRLRHLAQRREVEANRQRLVEAMELLDAQHQRQAAFDARLAAAERRTLQLMEQQLGLAGPAVRSGGSVVPTSLQGRFARRLGLLAKKTTRSAQSERAAPVTPTMVALFDTATYAADHPEAADSPLDHYLSKGEALGLRPNPWFDPLYYREKNPDVVRAGVSAFLHFCEYGGQEGRAPSAEFDTQWYWGTYPDARQSGLNPLLHFMLVGAALGYRATAHGVGGAKADR